MAIVDMPKSFAEALQIRAEKRSTPFAGGTDLMVKHRRCYCTSPDFGVPLLLLNRIEEIRGIADKVDFVKIGAGTTLTGIFKSEIAPKPLRAAIARMASVATRNIATIGGNICNASPAGDTLPPLYAMDAEVVLESVRGERVIPIDEFIEGVGKIDLAPDELLRDIFVPKMDFNKIDYKKVGTRRATALSKLSFIGLARIEGSEISDIRVAFGAVAPTVVRSREIERSVVGMKIEESSAIFDTLENGYSRLIRPIDDQRSTADYRKKTCLRLLEKFIKELK
jgi:CO/xanthine dehydrogenase FAD-binding subunit